MKPLSTLLVLLFSTVLAGAAPSLLEKLENWRHVPTEWADGDSFLVKTAEGKRFTIRLYGADSIEYHVTDGTDARRLREQRRYFGIAEFGETPVASIALAKSLGGEAARETTRLLTEPFTIHTSFADGRGDGKYKRIYAYITLADGRDLSATLVSKGHARAFGVYRARPDGTSGAAYKEELADLELRAAKLGLGAWTHTDWDKLPYERGEERKEQAETDLATGAKRGFSGAPLNVNTAARDEIMTLPGIGEITANRIIEGRPYSSLADLDEVEGIGKNTLERLAEYLNFSENP